MGIHLKVLNDSYPMSPCALDESSLSIRRVKLKHNAFMPAIAYFCEIEGYFCVLLSNCQCQPKKCGINRIVLVIMIIFKHFLGFVICLYNQFFHFHYAFVTCKTAFDL